MRGYWLTHSLFQKSEFFLVNLNFVEMRSIMNNCTGKWNILWWSDSLSCKGGKVSFPLVVPVHTSCTGTI